LTINLIKIISEIETSLTYCSLNKIHSSIITAKDLRKLTKQITDIDFWEISLQITCHCRIDDNEIEYLLEIPEYDSNMENKLIQVTPILIFLRNEMFMLDENKELIIKTRNRLLLTNACLNVKGKFYCRTNYIEINSCLYDIINNHHSENCKYHRVMDGFVIIKIENSNIVFIISKNIKNLNIQCQDYIKHKQIIGVYKFKTDKNCIINDYHLENHATKSKEIIFESFKTQINNFQFSNKSIELKQLDKQNIIINEKPSIENEELENNYHPIINTVVILIVIFIVIIVILIKFKSKGLIRKTDKINKEIEVQEIQRNSDKAPF